MSLHRSLHIAIAVKLFIFKSLSPSPLHILVKLSSRESILFKLFIFKSLSTHSNFLHQDWGEYNNLTTLHVRCCLQLSQDQDMQSSVFILKCACKDLVKLRGGLLVGGVALKKVDSRWTRYLNTPNNKTIELEEERDGRRSESS
ncbi:hypothetical protein P8452_13786 [Trifolium repens]|nr:hypothetical protein P8452_13786 [Trifolium repens]